jgi:hypothetical protein
MPNSTQRFNISGQGEVSPNGTSAQMSISGSNGLPNQAQWHTASAQVAIKLPSTVWNVTPNDGNAYQFTVAANSESPVFSLQANALQGTQMYVVDTGPSIKGGETRPTVIVNP